MVATLTATTAAVNSRRGIDIGLIGATRDLAIRKLTWNSFLVLTNLVYEISPIPFSLASASAAVNSRRGIDIGLIGATRDLAIRKLTWNSFLVLTNLVYEISPIPFSLASAKLWISARTGLPNSGGLIERGILAFSSDGNSLRHLSHLIRMWGSNGSSQSMFWLQSSCRICLPTKITGATIPRGS